MGPDYQATTVGANRNAILLRTHGCLLLSADDDTVARTAVVPTACDDKTVVIGGERDASGLWVFPSAADAIRFVEFREFSILDEHERLLGKALSGILGARDAASRVNLENACGHAFASLLSGCGRVMVSRSGIVGDAGIDSSAGLKLLPQLVARGRMLDSEESYNEFLTFRDVVRVVSVTVVSDLNTLLTTAIALDNRDILPPFMPGFRGEDGVFGTILSRCYDGTFGAQLPWAVLHLPPDVRQYSPAPLAGVRLSDIVSECILSWNLPLPSFGAAERLRSLGAHIKAIGELSYSDFVFSIRGLLWRRSGRIISACEAALKKHGRSPEFWAADLEREEAAARAACTDPSSVAPLDVLPGRSVEETNRITQGFLRRFGELLFWWPSIVERASDLARKGVGIGAAVGGCVS